MSVDLRFRGNIQIATSVTGSAVGPAQLVIRNVGKGNKGKLMLQGVNLPGRPILSLRQARFSFTPIQVATELQPSGKGFGQTYTGQLFPRGKFNTREVITTCAPVISGSNSYLAPTVVFRYAPGDSLSGYSKTFSRALPAVYTDITGSLRTVGNDVMRDGHYISGSATLLLEPARTNYLLQSVDFTNAAWSAGSSVVGAPVVTANQTTGPDAVPNSACKVVFPATVGAGAFSVLSQNPGGQSSTIKWLSFYAKGNVGGETTWQSTTPDGTVYTNNKDVLTTSWQRYSNSGSTNNGLYCQFGADLRDGAETATAALTLFVWGAQQESGSYPTSPILNTTVSQTRPADVLSITVPGGSGQSGSLYEKYIDLATNLTVEQVTIQTSPSVYSPAYGRAWYGWKFALGSQSLATMQGL